MIEPVDVLGMGAEGPSGLSPRASARLAAADFLAGGRRHLELVPHGSVERFAIADNLDELVGRLRGRKDGERCVVLASGDPLFYGIGHRLGQALGREALRVEPALSSVQLAFARVGLSWHEAAIASVHGRPLADTLLPLLNRPRIGLFTRDGSSPSEVARFFLDRGLDDYATWVCQRLGSADERIERQPIGDLPGRCFDPLNILILERSRSATGIDFRPVPSSVIPDHLYAQPDAGPVLLTHADVRSVALARFDLVRRGPIWDVGAGLGGVAVDLARAFSGLEVVAFERSEVQLGYLRENRARFAAYNLRVVAGEAPDSWEGEGRPSAIFLGGSGGRLDTILNQARDRLIEGGPLVANFVALENFARFTERVRGWGWPIEITQVQIWHGQPLAGLTSMVPIRPVWIVRATKPAA